MDTEYMGAFVPSELDELSINTIRFLSVDAVQQADSGHPGLPLGAAPMGYVLWTRFRKHNPAIARTMHPPKACAAAPMCWRKRRVVSRSCC